MSEYAIASTRSRITAAMARKIEKEIKAIDPTMDFVGPVYNRGNDLHGWIVRPNDGTNNQREQMDRNDAAEAVLARY